MISPEHKRTILRITAGAVFLFVAVWLMKALESVTTMIMVSLLLAYLLNPLVDRLERVRISRSLASFTIIFFFALCFVMLCLVIVPMAVGELTKFAAGAPEYLGVLKEQALRLVERYDIEIPQRWDEAFSLMLEKTKSWSPGFHKLANPLAQVLKTVFQSTMSLVSTALHIALIPILVYYLLASFNEMKDGVRNMIPPYARDSVLEKLGEMDQVISSFVRGQLTICSILAVLYSIGFMVIGIDLAVVLGVTSGYLFIIPYLGTLVGLAGGSIMAVAQYGDAAHAVYVIVWIAGVQLLESYVLTPNIVGDAIGLPPVAYILALIIGAQLFGFLGLLLAIPVAAVLKVLMKSVIDIYRRSDIYQDRTLESEER